MYRSLAPWQNNGYRMSDLRWAYYRHSRLLVYYTYRLLWGKYLSLMLRHAIAYYGTRCKSIGQVSEQRVTRSSVLILFSEGTTSLIEC